MLAALARAESAETIIDPMVGSADLLVSCLDVGATPTRLVGVELDPIALTRAQGALGDIAGVDLVRGDAFSLQLPAEQFDLVITNPPYIRYQARGGVDGVEMPSASAVRAGLVRAIGARRFLPDKVRDRLVHAARAYPGTSDIAVPAWILSAALVREGGVLAVVAPQAWLSRNYAQAVRELLDDAFDVEFIVEDGDASWFTEAQVRTHLVVARRRALGPRTRRNSVIQARATVELDTDGDLRGALGSESAVAEALRQVTAPHTIDVTVGLTAHVEHDLTVAAAGQIGTVPARVAAALGVEPGIIATRALESYGWRAGQGLRSGANDFFYLSNSDGRAAPAKRWGVEPLPIPPECLLPAVRRQSELGNELSIADAEMLPSRVLYLRDWVTSADKRRMGEPGNDLRVLPAPVARWIDEVGRTPLSDKDQTKVFPALAAVATNGKLDRSGRPSAFWYQLPKLAQRHRPSLFMGRVCGGQPIAYANPAEAVIDANFSTLWPTEEGALPRDALLALLHSSWVWANLEATCTVLGGGALKVEATDLRRLGLPSLSDEEIARLDDLGRHLLKRRDAGVLSAIDELVARAVCEGGCPVGLREFAEQARSRRSRA